MPRFDVVTIGGAVLDITLYTNAGQVISTPNNLTAQRMLAFEYGAKIHSRQAYFTNGGGAANVAVGVRRLGNRVAVICRVGKDESGAEINANFKKERVSTSYLQHDKHGVRTGVSFVLSADSREREHIVFHYRGANENLEITARDLRTVSTRWFYLTSLSGDRWNENLDAIFATRKKQNVKIAWNPGYVQLKAGYKALAPYLKQTNMLILNKDEAIELVLSGMKVGRRNPSYLNQPKYLLNIIQDWGPKVVVVTAGKKGAMAFDGSTIYQQRAVRAKAVDSCGIGDAFSSGFISGYLATKGNVKESLRWGAINSGSTIAKVGAQNGLLPLREMLRKIKK